MARLAFLTSFATSTFSFQILGKSLVSPSGFLPLPFSTSTVFYQLSGQREIGPILLFSIHGLYTTLFYQPWVRLTFFSNTLYFIISESSSMARTRLFRAALHSLHSQHTSVTFFFGFLGGSLRANFNSLPQPSFSCFGILAFTTHSTHFQSSVGQRNWYCFGTISISTSTFFRHTSHSFVEFGLGTNSTSHGATQHSCAINHFKPSPAGHRRVG